MYVGYKKPKSFVLTPRRKVIGKAVARRSHRTVASECLSNKETRKYVLAKIGREIGAEVKHICSDFTNSILQSRCKKTLESFSWNVLHTELQKYCPLLLHVLQCAIKNKEKRVQKGSHWCLCRYNLQK